MWVAVGEWVAQRLAVVANAYEVASPGVDTYARNLNATLGDGLESLDDFII